MSSTLKRTVRRLILESADPTIVQAFKNTPPDYMARTLAQRNAGASAAGSTFSTPQTEESLLSADWEPFSHPNLDTSEGAHGYKADIPGVCKAVGIDTVPSDTPVALQPGHGGGGKTQSGQPTAEAVAVLPGGGSVDFTTLIVGPISDSDPTEAVWTFYPGEPTARGKEILLSDVQRDFGGKTVVLTTAGEAMAYGFVTLKHVDRLPVSEGLDLLRKLIEGEVVSLRTGKRLDPRTGRDIENTVMDIQMEYEDKLLDVLRDSKFIDEVVDDLREAVPGTFEEMIAYASAQTNLRTRLLEGLSAFFDDVRANRAHIDED